MIEIPEADYSKEKGIRGLKQIAVQCREENNLEQRIEIIARYLSKFQKRMSKIGTPISDNEKSQIYDELMEIIIRKN